MRLARTGAVLYILWAVIHLFSALNGFRLAGALQDGGLALGRLHQSAFYLAAFAILAGIVAIRMNWRNSVLGYQTNLVIVSTASLGTILFILLPGHVAMWPGIAGSIVWVAALAVSTLAVRLEPPSA